MLNILLKARDSAGKIKESKKIIFTVIIAHLHALIRFYKLHDPESGPDYIAIEPIRNASNIIEMIMCREYGGNEATVIAAEAAKMSIRRIYGE